MTSFRGLVLVAFVASCGGAVTSEERKEPAPSPTNVPGGSGTATKPDEPPVPIPDPTKPPPSWHVEHQEDPKTEMVLTGVWGANATDVYVSGEYGLILHRDKNAKWTAQASGEKGHLWSVWGRSATDLFVGGDGYVLRSNGNGQWKREGMPQPGRVVGFLPDGAGVLAVVEGGYLVRTYGGGVWTIVPSSSVTLAAATRLSSGAFYAVGPSAQIHGGAPGAWKEEKTNVPSFTVGCDPPPVGFPCDPAMYKPALFGVWAGDPKDPANSGKDLYAVGQYGVIVHSLNGGEWKVEQISKDLAPQLFAITATSAKDLWVAGDEIVLRGNGNGAWTSVDVGAKDFYRAAWSTGSDVYIVGGHTIVHRY